MEKYHSIFINHVIEGFNSRSNEDKEKHDKNTIQDHQHIHVAGELIIIYHNFDF